MPTRRGWGQDAISFEHTEPCRDLGRHRSCAGRWRGIISLGYGPGGKRRRRKVSGPTKTVVQERLKKLHDDIDAGVRAKPGYTVRQAAEDWLMDGMNGRDVKTISKNEYILAPLLAELGSTKLRELSAGAVGDALAAMACTYSTAVVSMAHSALTRAITHAQARDLASRNVSALITAPKGQKGRPSKSLTRAQAAALLAASSGTMNAYITLCLTTGIRTEEARALTWQYVDFGDPDTSLPRPASVAVWRSVRATGDTKTQKSRRTLALPRMAADALRAHRERQDKDRATAGRDWQNNGLVFTTRTGKAIDASNIRKQFKVACRAAGIEGTWTPRELRHSFVSLLSEHGTLVEEIARLAGHSSTRTTEVIYRQELRPVLTTGAEAMDKLFIPEGAGPCHP
jgi:integrase